MSQPYVVGINASHNGAVCLLKGNKIVVAIQEERLTRQKRTTVVGPVPPRALGYCLDYAGIKLQDVAAVGLCSYSGYDRLFHPAFRKKKVVNLTHHRGHALAALATSGESKAAILVVDGCGSFVATLSPEERAIAKYSKVERSVTPDNRMTGFCETVSIYDADGLTLTPKMKLLSPERGALVIHPPRFSHFGSLGCMFGAAAIYSFGDIGAAGKVMGLAPYGDKKAIRQGELVTFERDTLHFHDALPERYVFDAWYPHRALEHAHIAAGVQGALETVLLQLAQRAKELTDANTLIFTGGVALNCVANEVILRSGLFDRVFIQPAAEDSGTSIGAAYAALWSLTNEYVPARLDTDGLGMVYPTGAVEAAAGSAKRLFDSRDVAGELAQGKVVAIFDGGSELGPRALGHRSLLFDARREDAQEILNQVKGREQFRPVAPVVIEEHAGEWFDVPTKPITNAGHFMLRSVPVRPEKLGVIPGAAHVDGSARIQLVGRSESYLCRILTEFYHLTGVPVLINTSFNGRNEPIIETPREAVNLWHNTPGIHGLVIDGRYLDKR